MAEGPEHCAVLGQCSGRTPKLFVTKGTSIFGRYEPMCPQWTYLEPFSTRRFLGLTTRNRGVVGRADYWAESNLFAFIHA
jgi:hypothetical protein